MREFALVKDAFRDELFAIVTRDNGLTTCHGIHDAGREWAHSYNQGQTKSLKSSLEPGVSIGPFAPITPGMQALIDESLEGKSVRFPDLNSLRFVESVNFRHQQSIPQVKDARLRNITLSGLHRGADYKAMAFLLDKGRSSALLKARLGSMGFDKDGIGFKSRHIEKGILNEEMSDTTIGYGNARRTVKDVIIRKDLLMQEHGGYIVKDKPEPIEVIRTKANRLGRRLAPGGGGGIGGGIRKIGRSMKDPFDPSAWDGDRDGIVQEGTIWERPSVPGININLPGTRSTRSKPDNFPADDPRRVGRDIERRQNQDKIVSDLLGGSVRDALNDDRLSEEAIGPLKELLKYHGDEDEIWDTPLADIGGMKGGEEEALDDFLEYAVEDIEEHLHERNRQTLRDAGFGRSTRSQRDDAPRTTEAQRREDGSYDPPPGYETWADFEADWPDDDDDIDVDTERVVDERDEYPDDWGGQLGATEGGTRSQRLRQGDKVTVRHNGKDVEGTVVRFGRGGLSGAGVDSYVIDVGELRSIWKRPDEILKVPDPRGGGFRSGRRPSHGRGRPERKPRGDSRSDRVRRGEEGDAARRRADREGRDWGWGDLDDDERDSTRSQRGDDSREMMEAVAKLGDNPLDERIARDRDGGMTLEEAAQKYGISREVIRAREIQHRRRVADGGTRSQRPGQSASEQYYDQDRWLSRGETGRGRSHSAHLTSDELVELNDVLNEARKAFDGAVFGPMRVTRTFTGS